MSDRNLKLREEGKDKIAAGGGRSGKEGAVLADSLVRRAEETARLLTAARTAIGAVIIGQPRAVTLSLATLLSGGHLLLVGVPGLAKTRLVETIATVMGMKHKRVQCTPDLMPADILGSEILGQDRDGLSTFRFIEGPIFTQLFMADEINRASPRTQSALLQAMQEHHVTIAGQRYDLPMPFHVLATQNPIEQEGTYPLPEAQLDRFLMQVDIGYPDRTHERDILLATTGAEQARPAEAMTPQQLIEAQDLIRRLPVGESVVEAILTLVRAGRPDESAVEEVRAHVAWGPGPRASQALMLATRALAFLDGRFAPSIDDVLDLAVPVLKHRMALHFSAIAEGVTVEDIITKLCEPLR